MSMNIYIRDIIEKCHGKLICGDLDLVCQDFSKDTRTIKENDIYVGIKGNNFDGNLFYQDAFEKGAKACILDNASVLEEIELYANKTIVLVEDSVKMLQELASYKRGLYDIPVVAITGSVGKTSTKDMIASVLEKKYNVLKTEGNNNNHIGLPLTILKLKDHDCMVLEMGMNNLGEISLLTNIAKPTVCLVTNIGTAHIGNLGSRENILKAKLEIVEGLKEKGTIIINNDDNLLANEVDRLSRQYQVITIGIENKSNYCASKIKEKEEGILFKIETSNFQLKQVTKVFIYNALFAFAIGKIFNIDDNLITLGITNFKLSANRLDIITNNKGVTIINDTYNASYDSVISSLELLKKTKGKRKIAVLGDILELGIYAKEIHQSIGKYIAKEQVDILITVGNDSKYINETACSLGYNKDNSYHFSKQEETKTLLSELLEKDDVILLKGSHGINLIEIVKRIK